MKVRLIKKPDYDTLYAVEVKRWWWPFWTEVYFNGQNLAEDAYQRILKTGCIIEVIKQGEIK